MAFVWSLGYARYCPPCYGDGKIRAKVGKTRASSDTSDAEHMWPTHTHKSITDKYLLHFLLGSDGKITNDG